MYYSSEYTNGSYEGGETSKLFDHPPFSRATKQFIADIEIWPYKNEWVSEVAAKIMILVFSSISQRTNRYMFANAHTILIADFSPPARVCVWMRFRFVLFHWRPTIYRMGQVTQFVECTTFSYSRCFFLPNLLWLAANVCTHSQNCSEEREKK